MVYYLKVTAKNRSTGETKSYDQVYDIGHYYGYNGSPELEHSTLRLLIGNPFSTERTQIEYINLAENDVEITLGGQDERKTGGQSSGQEDRRA